ncbi:MAG: HAD family hydrolase [Bacteroidales bacterium]|jgi:D-glycero-D-manno-heptose 1,7-bisphosphate phosphatase|nr:HAD family hydrolase [Bacteroidales bacterium]
MSDLINYKNIIQQWNINESWTLFLDRDGVINQRKIGGYITMIDEFEFTPGALQALANANKIFGKIIVVTNQQGVGKGIMTDDDVKQIHEHMISIVEKHNGRIDAVYYSPFLAELNHQSRKPNPGMAFQAAKDFPEINFKRCIMLGDAPTDMEFANSVGMKSVFIGNPEEFDLSSKSFDISYPSFLDFIKDLMALCVN